MYSKRIHAAWFGIHFFLITAVCLAGVFWLIAQGSTILPSACRRVRAKAELVADLVSGKRGRSFESRSERHRNVSARRWHPGRVQLFAPNVPSQHRLTLELLYEDGRVEYESPHVRGKTAALRLESLLDRLAEERYEPVREVLVKMLAFSVWREHPDVKKVRATFGAVNPPGMNEFEQGKTETFQPMFSFDFSLRDDQKQ